MKKKRVETKTVRDYSFHVLASQSLINVCIHVSVFVSILVTIHTMSLFGLGSRNQKTFRPKKNAPSGSKGAQLQKHIDATLGSGNLREAVRLPPGEDINEWLAVNTVDFFNQVNILYGTLTEFCTAANCPTMTAGPKYEYRWADGVTIKKPIEVSAPRYVEYLMDWIEAQLDYELIFPQKLGAPFPPNFQDVVKTIFKRLFRVYAHIYHSHFQKIEFRLIDKGELAPLYDLVESILKL
ncbi:MOB kinase activator-like 1A isoform X1 [Populus alba x Populus x berolinensis]|nr:MOB kinase activator-like 1A isoform X1 [Populus alba x Populus x berolinensis]